MKYIGGMRDELRKKNSAKLKPAFGADEDAVSKDAMGDNADLGDDDISSLLEDASSAENEMGDDFAGDGKDVGDKDETVGDDKDQTTEGKDPAGALFKKKSKQLTKG